MAHVGPRYPLHFRRDFGTNTTTRFGWAKTYKVSLVDGFGHKIFGAAQPDPWFSDGGVAGPGFSLVFTGTPFVNGAFTEDWQIEYLFSETEATAAGIFLNIRRDGVTWWRQQNTNRPFKDYKTMGGFGWQQLFSHRPPGVLQPFQAPMFTAKPW